MNEIGRNRTDDKEIRRWGDRETEAEWGGKLN
jgi:hypothetical protein